MTKQAKAKLNELRMAPRKVRLLIDLIRGMDAKEAETQLKLSKKKAAQPVLKLLRSAMANAEHNHNLDKSTLSVKIAKVDQGPTLKRWKPRAFGRSTPIHKKSSHVTIVLKGEQAEEGVSTAKEKKTEAEETETNQVEQVTEETRKKLMRKTKDEIKEYAQEEYGIELSTDDLKKEMLDQFMEELNK